ncbi:MAG: hypothetical protein ACQESA_00085 [Patescibacteria group bacterium]
MLKERDELKKQIREKLITHRYLSGAFAGFLLGIGFVIPQLWWIYVLGLFLLFWLWANVASRGKAAILGFISWTVSGSLSVFWAWSVFPISYLEDFSSILQFSFIGICWFLSAAFLGLAGMVCGFFVWCFFQAKKPLYLVLVPVFWLVCEIAGSIFFSLFTIGEGAFLNARFSFSYLGYHLAHYEPLFHLSALGGVYILSLAAVTVVIIIWYINRFKNISLSFITVFILALAVLGYGLFYFKESPNVEPKGLRIAVLQTYFDREFRSNPDMGSKQHELMRKGVVLAGETSADHILLPEDTRFLNGFSDYQEAKSWLSKEFATSSVQLIGSGKVSLGDESVLKGFLYNNDTNSLYRFDKQYLVPQGEFLSYLFIRSVSFLGQDDALNVLSEVMNYVPGSDSQSNLPDGSPAVLFCFENVSPYGVKSLVMKRKEKVPFIVNMVSLSWFDNSHQLEQRLDTMLRVQARWSGVHIVFAGNMAESKVYTPYGDVLNNPVISKRGDSHWWDLLVFEI